jgi:hypothetical protein
MQDEHIVSFDRVEMIKNLEHDDPIDRRIIYELIGKKLDYEDDFEDVFKKSEINLKSGSWVKDRRKSTIY